MIYESTHDLNSGYLDNIEVGKEVWAFWFERFGGRSGRIHNKAPMLGVLTGSDFCPNYIKYFVPYKIKGKEVTKELDTKKKLSAHQLTYADNYEEAVEHYNKLIQEEIDFLENKLKALRKCIIEEDKK